MPRLRCHIVDPCGVCGWKNQHVEAVAVLLVGVPNSVRQVAVLLDVPLDSVSRNALTRVAVGPVDHALTTGVFAQPKQAVVHLGNRVGGSAAQLVKRAGDAGEREVRVAAVVPDFDGVSAVDPQLPVVNDDANHAVWGAFSRRELQRVDLRTIKQRSHPDLLAVRLVKHEVAVQIAHSACTGKVWVGDLLKGVCIGVVNERGAVASNEQLNAVVNHADRPSACHCTDQRHHVCGSDLVQLVGADHVHVACQNPQPTDGACAHCHLQIEAGGAVQERRFFTSLRHDLRKQVDHAGIRSVDTAGHI